MNWLKASAPHLLKSGRFVNMDLWAWLCTDELLQALRTKVSLTELRHSRSPNPWLADPTICNPMDE